MQLSNIPGKLVLPFANAGGKSTIPVASQIGIAAGAASLTDGFPPLTRTPIAAGGVPPSGLDMNGILYEMSAIIRWANAGGGYPYDSVFANDTNVGGYPKGARVMRSDGTGYWFNTVENNVTDPEAVGAAAAGWVPDYQSGATSVAMSGSSVTLTPNQYGKPLIVITGTLSANLNLIFPALAQGWTVMNNATGGYSITAKTAIGSGVTLGTISQIVGDGTNMYAANPDSVQIVNNVATLRNIAPSLSRYIQTRGYYTDGDGGSGQYYAKIGASPGTYVHNGGTVIVPNGGDGSSAWLLDVVGVISVKQFGAKGDGVNDDTSTIQSTINSIETGSYPNYVGGSFYAPKGIYLTSGPLYMRRSTSFLGDGAEVTVIKPTVALTSSCLFVGVDGDVPRTNAGIIEGVGLDGSNTTSNSAFGFNIWASGMQIRNCKTYGFYYGLYAKQSWTAKVNNSNFTNARRQNIFIDQECHNMAVRDCRILYSAHDGIRVSSSNSVVIDGCDIEQNSENGLIHDADNGVASRNLSILNNYFENNGPYASTPGTGNDVYLLESVGTDCSGVCVLNNHYEPGASATVRINHQIGSVFIQDNGTANLIVTNGDSLITKINSSNNYGLGTAALPSNPLNSNKYLSLGNTVTESIGNISVGTSAVQLTKNGNMGGIAFLTISQPGGGGNWNGVVAWTANGSATVIGQNNNLANGATVTFGVIGAYNGALSMTVSTSSGGPLYVSGIAITTNRY